MARGPLLTPEYAVVPLLAVNQDPGGCSISETAAGGHPAGEMTAHLPHPFQPFPLKAGESCLISRGRRGGNRILILVQYGEDDLAARRVIRHPWVTKRRPGRPKRPGAE